MYLLDTNVVSELRRPRPHGGVSSWLRAVDHAALFLPALVLAELQAGIELTRRQDRRRAAELEAWLDGVAATAQVLDMTGPIFRLWAKLMHGKSPDLAEDGMIAATAEAHAMTVVTRNTRHFAAFGRPTLDPFATGRAAKKH